MDSVGVWVLRGLGAAAFLGWFLHIVEAWLCGWIPRRLSALPAEGPDVLPKLSVVVPALNEESTIEPAMKSLLALDYHDFEIIAVDDRSTDSTGAILDRLAAAHPALRVIHVKELPPGWLGKNHAMHAASRDAKGGFILFTDADVHFDPGSLKRAVRAAVADRLDHVTVFPDTDSEEFWEGLCVWFFAVIFAMHSRPWKVADPASSAHTGIGAFNLVRAEVYRRMGGHASMPMEVVDDMKLGKRMKSAGGRSEPMSGAGMVRVRWVVGVRGMIEGLTKNAFAAFGFRTGWAVTATLLQLFIVVWPFLGIWLGPWDARILCAGAIASMVALAWPARPAPRIFPLASLLFPVASAVLAYAIFRSMKITLSQGGVRWRGTLYPLQDLRKGVV